MEKGYYILAYDTFTNCYHLIGRNRSRVYEISTRTAWKNKKNAEHNLNLLQLKNDFAVSDGRYMIIYILLEFEVDSSSFVRSLLNSSLHTE